MLLDGKKVKCVLARSLEVRKLRCASGDLSKSPTFENSFDSLAEQRRERLNGNEAMSGKQTDG